MADHRERLYALVDHTLANRGGTFDAVTLEPVNPASGYAVAIGHIGSNGALLTRDSLYDRLNRTVLDLRAPYVGTWVDTNRFGNDVAYVDHVVILPDRESALILARAFRELAIWDFSTSTEVRLDTAEAA